MLKFLVNVAILHAFFSFAILFSSNYLTGYRLAESSLFNKLVKEPPKRRNNSLVNNAFAHADGAFFQRGLDPFSEIQMHRYFNLTTKTFNETRYFDLFNGCFFVFDRLIKCSKGLNNINRERHKMLFLHNSSEKNTNGIDKRANTPYYHHSKLGIGFSNDEIRMQNPHGLLNSVVLRKYTNDNFFLPGSISPPPPSRSPTAAATTLPNAPADDRDKSNFQRESNYLKEVLRRVHVHTVDCFYETSIYYQSLFVSSLRRRNNKYSSEYKEILVVRLEFDILQYNCSDHNSLPNIRGGATFEGFISSHDRGILSRCDHVDFFNNSYRSLCEFELDLDSSSSGTTLSASLARTCLNVSLFLEYEHFDAYSEALADWTSDYPPLFHHVILSSHVVCLGKLEGFASLLTKAESNIASNNGSEIRKKRGSFDRSSSSSSSSSYSFNSGGDSVNHGNKLSKGGSGNDIWWYTCKWQKSADSKNITQQQSFNISSYFENHPPVINSAQLDDLVFELLKSHSEKSNSLLDHETLQLLSHKDVVRPLSLSGYFVNSYRIFDSFTVSRSSSHKSISSLFSGSNIDTAVESLDSNLDHNKLRDAFGQSDMKYIFIGASHMRYLYDSTLMYFRGLHDLENVDRKHEHHIGLNGKMEFISSLYAYNQSRAIHRICASRCVSKSPLTIVLQTGAWDLSISPIRRVLKDDFSAKLLISTIEMVYNESIPCACLRHIVWITPVPYPLCRNIDDPGVVARNSCNSNRGYRSNHAISALNRFYLEGFDAVFETSSTNRRSKAKTLTFSIVDAFSIISPRLVFSDLIEVVCGNHFICHSNLLEHSDIRQKVNTSSLVTTITSRLYPGKPETSAHYMVFTPGGYAFFTTFLTLIENNILKI